MGLSDVKKLKLSKKISGCSNEEIYAILLELVKELSKTR